METRDNDDSGHLHKLRSGIIGAATAAVIGVTSAFSPTDADANAVENPQYGETASQEAQASVVCEGEFTAPLILETYEPVSFQYREDVVPEESDGLYANADMNILEIEVPAEATERGNGGTIRYLDVVNESPLLTDEYEDRKAEIYEQQTDGTELRILIDPDAYNPNRNGEKDVMMEKVRAETAQITYNTFLNEIWEKAQENQDLCSLRTE